MVQYSAVWCGAVQCIAMWFGVVLVHGRKQRTEKLGALQCSVMRCGAVHCTALWCGAVQCGTVQCIQSGVVWCGVGAWQKAED